jgi:predicted lipoprotein
LLRDRYSTNQVFDEIIQLVPKLAPTLAAIDQYLEDERLFGLIKADLSKRHPQTMQTGRTSTPVEVVLRMLVVKRLCGYSYEETERYLPSDSRQIADSVRVLARTVERVRKIQQTVIVAGEDFTQTARRTARKIGETLRKRTKEAQEAGRVLYRELIEMTPVTVEQA